MTNDEMILQLVELIMTSDCDFPPDFIADVHRFINEVYLSDAKLELLKRGLLYGKFFFREQL